MYVVRAVRITVLKKSINSFQFTNCVVSIHKFNNFNMNFVQFNSDVSLFSISMGKDKKKDKEKDVEKAKGINLHLICFLLVLISHLMLAV